MIRRFVQFLQGQRNKVEPRGPSTRVTLGALNSIFFDWTDVSPARTIPAANISSTGIGLMTPDLKGLAVEGSSIRGHLKIRDKEFPVVLEVVHRNGQITGCRYVNPDFQLPITIQSFLETELVSSGMKPVAKDLIYSRPGEECLWFRDKNGNELFAVQKNSEIVEAQLVILGSYIEYNPRDESVNYGVISDEEGSGEISSYVRSDFDVRFLKQRPPELRGLIEKFILSVQGLKPDFKTKLLDCFQRGIE
ncbi:MAG: hypothetical protein K2X47_12840 [Bdellovibrionales bacterium]|nr:hypothetical protein [Bdellovibrionales bacterium]